MPEQAHKVKVSYLDKLVGSNVLLHNDYIWPWANVLISISHHGGQNEFFGSIIISGQKSFGWKKYFGPKTIFVGREGMGPRFWGLVIIGARPDGVTFGDCIIPSLRHSFKFLSSLYKIPVLLTLMKSKTQHSTHPARRNQCKEPVHIDGHH